MGGGRSRLQFALAAIAAAAACVFVAGILITWYAFFQPAVTINQLAAGEEVVSNCFTVGCGCNDRPNRCNAIFGVRGRLSSRNWVLATLYSVQKGSAQRVSSITVTVPARPTTDLLPSDFYVRFALCEHDESLSPKLMLGVAGRKIAAGSGWFLSARRRATNVRVLSGPVPTGRCAIAYVEGDKAVTQPTMSVPAFAEENSDGDYIVVAVQMVSAADADLTP
jgi:hypothetical protein